MENKNKSVNNDGSKTRSELLNYLSETFSFPCEWRNKNGHMFRTDCASELVTPIEETANSDKNVDAADIKKIVDLWQVEWNCSPLPKKHY